jgi:paraquat-inducible protein B
VDSLSLRHLQAALGLVISPALLAATEPAAGPTPAAATAKPAVPEPTLVLPTVTVSQSRIRQIDNEIRKLDKLIAREEKKLKSTELDKTLNNAQVSTAAALFGGNSAEHLAAVAASRMGLLQTERDVLESMKRPASREALAMMDAELDQLRTTRRNLDKVGR